MGKEPVKGSMQASDITRQAELLRDCYAANRAMPPIREAFPNATVADAYAIQESNTAFWEGEGRRIVGAKTGLTAKAVQKQLGVDQPDFGMLYADMAVPDGDEIAPGRLIQPKVEAEVAFVMARAVDVDRLTTAELINAVAFAVPALEIVDSRIAEWNIGIVDTIADNASSGLFVLGTEPSRLDGLDLKLCGMVLEKNGDQVSFGAGIACLGHPLHALGWLARTLAQVGRPLAEGDVVLSGALGPMVAAAPGDRFEARINGLGSVNIRFGGGK